MRLWDADSGMALFAGYSFENGRVVLDLLNDVVVEVAGEGWRNLGWLPAPARDCAAGASAGVGTGGVLLRYPAESFGPLPQALVQWCNELARLPFEWAVVRP